MAIVTTTVSVSLVGFCNELVDELAARGFSVSAVTSPSELNARFARTHGLVVRALAMERQVSLRADVAALARWVALLRRERPQLVIALTPKASLLGMVAARLTGVPERVYLLVGLRAEGAHGIERQVLRVMERLTSACATVVVANSPSLAATAVELRMISADKILHIEPGSDHGVRTDHFRPGAVLPLDLAALGLSDELITILHVGRVTADKGLPTLIEALTDDSARRTTQLLVVGPHDEADSAQLLADLESSGIRHVAVGPVEDVRPYFAAADIHVLPSHREGFPNVVLEAGAMGLPTITTNGTGCVDSVIDGETGVIVPVGDASALRDAVLKLATNAPLRARYGQAAQTWVVANFQPEAVTRRLLDLASQRAAPDLPRRARR